MCLNQILPNPFFRPWVSLRALVAVNPVLLGLMAVVHLMLPNMHFLQFGGENTMTLITSVRIILFRIMYDSFMWVNVAVRWLEFLIYSWHVLGDVHHRVYGRTVRAS